MTYVNEKCHWKGLQAELDPDFTLSSKLHPFLPLLLSFTPVSTCFPSLLPPFFCTDFLYSKVAKVATASPSLQCTSSMTPLERQYFFPNSLSRSLRPTLIGPDYTKVSLLKPLLLLLLSHFSRIRLCATLSLGFSRQEHWSRLPFPSPMHKSEKWKWSRSVMSDSSQPYGLQPTRLLRPWDFPGKSTGVGCHCPVVILMGWAWVKTDLQFSEITCADWKRGGLPKEKIRMLLPEEGKKKKKKMSGRPDKGIPCGYKVGICKTAQDSNVLVTRTTKRWITFSIPWTPMVFLKKHQAQ